jgi:glutamate 5-kinase
VEVKGEFGAGEVVGVLDPDGVEFARGLVHYEAGEIRRILGAKTADIENILGYKYLDEVIHRDNLVLL